MPSAQQRVVTPARWIVRRSHIDDAFPENGDIVSRQTTESAARRYVRRHMRLLHLRTAYSWTTERGVAYNHNSASVYHIEQQSLEDYTREQNERD